jgi:hypothetical protein
MLHPYKKKIHTYNTCWGVLVPSMLDSLATSINTHTHTHTHIHTYIIPVEVFSFQACSIALLHPSGVHINYWKMRPPHVQPTPQVEVGCVRAVICVYMYVCIHVYPSGWSWLCESCYMCVYVCMYTRIPLRLKLAVSELLYVCMYVCMCVYICI